MKLFDIEVIEDESMPEKTVMLIPPELNRELARLEFASEMIDLIGRDGYKRAVEEVTARALKAAEEKRIGIIKLD